MTWYYKKEEFTETPEEYQGFVYLITEKDSGKKYVGKKNFWKPAYKTVKGKRKRIKKESDWRDYFGSSKDLQEAVEANGNDKYHREILHLCKKKGHMSYLELKEQIDRGVLFDDSYYNAFVGAKINASFVKDLEIEKI